tara:strand:+ start:2731 stop:2889 length:159 start_codon:yes stop_codon:yes gene_type:complete
MKNELITDKAVSAAMEAIEKDLRESQCSYARMVIIRNSLIDNLRQSLQQNFG